MSLGTYHGRKVIKKRTVKKGNKTTTYYTTIGNGHKKVVKKRPTKKPSTAPKPSTSTPSTGPRPTPAGVKANKVQDMRKTEAAAQAKLGNKAPTPHGEWSTPGRSFQFAESQNHNGGATAARQMNFNLDNNDDLAQGSQNPWAQPTSISSLISGQLRQAANSPTDAWEAWASNKVGGTTISDGSTPFGKNVSYNGGSDQVDQMQQESAGVNLSNSQPMGAFGTSKVMYDLGEDPGQMSVEGPVGNAPKYSGSYDPNDPYFKRSTDGTPLAGTYQYAVDTVTKTTYDPKKYDGERTVKEVGKMSQEEFWWLYYNEPAFQQLYKKNGGDITKMGATKWKLPVGDYSLSASKIDPKTGVEMGKKPMFFAPAKPGEPGTVTGPGTTGDAAKPTPLPMYDHAGDGSNPVPNDIFGGNELHNPWGRLQGAPSNAMGPSSQTMGNATMEALSLANAYFAPQRAELAYELGDMETDMRRLAVNLGRQTDDPVLQAKLYKEGMRAVRTLDIQQNTFAFQMADARRKEENANWQFYDQLAQNEAQLKIQNRQYYDSLDLQRSQYNLQNWSVSNPPEIPSGTSPPTTGTSPAGGQQSQEYKSGANSVTSSGSGIYKARY